MTNDKIIEVLKAALLQWVCPSCGGSRTYLNKYIVKGPKLIEELIPCKKCAGTGIHPTASHALEKVKSDVSEVHR